MEDGTSVMEFPPRCKYSNLPRAHSWTGNLCNKLPLKLSSLSPFMFPKPSGIHFNLFLFKLSDCSLWREHRPTGSSVSMLAAKPRLWRFEKVDTTASRREVRKFDERSSTVTFSRRISSATSTEKSRRSWRERSLLRWQVRTGSTISIFDYTEREMLFLRQNTGWGIITSP